MGGTVTSPSRCSPTPSSPPSGPKAGTSRRHSHKKGLQKRRPRTAFLHSRESEGSRGADGLRSAKAPVPIGLVSTTSILPRSTLLVGVASSPSGGSQTLPLQTERRAAGMNYTCSTRARGYAGGNGRGSTISSFLRCGLPSWRDHRDQRRAADELADPEQERRQERWQDRPIPVLQ